VVAEEAEAPPKPVTPMEDKPGCGGFGKGAFVCVAVVF
jgi:hypothetical protein